ncbi:unnamed protein product [Haemonchus placei]|uniref:Homeobox protein araucan n=1 Tax=Haemonchus placei TaxID=6290 RepID=A0A0N4X6A1_HAEPC|nr:unnamed protein product [Haemonchus placei]VDO79989.1 unnamed protein product [Haemonchus placei]
MDRSPTEGFFLIHASRLILFHSIKRNRLPAPPSPSQPTDHTGYSEKSTYPYGYDYGIPATGCPGQGV